MKTLIPLAGLMLAGSLCAQNPLTNEAKAMYTGIKNNIIKAADKMSEENYAFKPSPDVRGFGQLVGHVADAQYLFCAGPKGEPAKRLGIEKSKTSKADLTAALKDAFAYCDAVYESMTDAKATEALKFFNREMTKVGVLHFNNSHNNEHYGNIVTYMRIKGLVPPSSEGR